MGWMSANGIVLVLCISEWPKGAYPALHHHSGENVGTHQPAFLIGSYEFTIGHHDFYLTRDEMNMKCCICQYKIQFFILPVFFVCHPECPTL